MLYEFGIPLKPKLASIQCQLQVLHVEPDPRQKILHAGRFYGHLLRRKLCLRPAPSNCSFSTHSMPWGKSYLRVWEYVVCPLCSSSPFPIPDRDIDGFWRVTVSWASVSGSHIL